MLYYVHSVMLDNSLLVNDSNTIHEYCKFNESVK